MNKNKRRLTKLTKTETYIERTARNQYKRNIQIKGKKTDKIKKKREKSNIQNN